jgi:hypothetical protein
VLVLEPGQVLEREQVAECTPEREQGQGPVQEVEAGEEPEQLARQLSRSKPS